MASWDTSSLSAVLYSSKSDFSKHKKGLSHEISRMFNQSACNMICVSPQSSSVLYSKSTCVSLIKDCLIFLRYLRAQPAHDSSWDTSYLSPRTLLKQICLSSLQKGLSHAIFVRIYRQTTCTLRGVASWDTSSLSQGSSPANLPFKIRKGLSHEIFRIYRHTTCTLLVWPA